MANGILGKADLLAAADTTIYTVPADTFAVVTISLCNRGGSSAGIRIAVCDSATPATDEYLEFDAEILSSGVLERTGIVIQAGKLVVVRSDSVAVSAQVYGIETSTL